MFHEYTWLHFIDHSIRMFHKVGVLLEYIDIFLRHATSTDDYQPNCNILPIMLTLCLMLLGTYYAKNYPSIIGLGLLH